MPGMSPLSRRRARRSQVRLAQEAGAPSAGTRAAGSQTLVRLPAVLLACGCLWFLASLLGGDRFRVAAVHVTGVQQLAEEDITEVVAVAGRSVFLVRTGQMEERLLETYGCLRSASVTARLPNSVSVAVEEESVAIIWESGGRYWWVGEDGRVLGEASEPRGLAVVRDLAGVAPEPTTHVVGVPVRLAQDLHDALPTSQSYDYTPEQGLVVYVTAAGWPVYLGHEGDAPTKVAILRALVDELLARGTDVEYIDLRNERRPTYMPAS